jgi:hypothetical protein
MTITVETIPRCIWRRSIFPSLTLVCGLALAAGVVAIQTWPDAPAALRGSRNGLSPASQDGPGGNVQDVVYIVDSREAALSIEAGLNERPDLGRSRTSVVVAETEEAINPIYEAAYEAWSLQSGTDGPRIIDVARRLAPIAVASALVGAAGSAAGSPDLGVLPDAFVR